MNYTYLVMCRDKSLYCGWTNNIEDRVDKHNGIKKGGAKYTRCRRPVKLVYYEIHETRSLAMKRECAIKKLSRKKKLELMKKMT
jgi:putative endonuclease